MKGKNVRVSVAKDGKGLDFGCPGWKEFSLGHLVPSVHLDGARRVPDLSRTKISSRNGELSARFSFDGASSVRVQLKLVESDVLRMRCRAVNKSPHSVVLNRISLLETTGAGSGGISLGRSPSRIRVMTQSNYRGKVLPLDQLVEKEKSVEGELTTVVSDLVWAAYDSESRRAFVVGFETSERWRGQIEMSLGPDGAVEKWAVGFDGGDLLVEPGEALNLEEVVFLAGPDPWRLLERYAERVKRRHKVKLPAAPPVSWCSWYPYRLGVTEERILENARVAVQRLRALGLSIMEVDLGWEKGHLPSAFEENDRFPHGLKWLSGELRKLGFDLGVWKAPFTISEFDPLAAEHPEYLIPDESGNPAAYWTWFWEPHGKVFILDLTHPGAQAWLKGKMDSLSERAVKYFKADFIGCVSAPQAKRRRDQRVVAGGGYEAARIGAGIIRDALPDALILNCGGPEMPGTGQWPLLYACRDTGNTGFVGWDFHRDNYLALACHLFKSRRWGILQPSCLCVGLPGTIGEAQTRATTAFMAGGQVDISDNLLSLPEDRWRILTATLPPLGITAKPVDLFEPLTAAILEYDGMTTGRQKKAAVPQEHPPGSVWHLKVKQDWDEWDLVSVFDFGKAAVDKSGNGESADKAVQISRFVIPFERLNLAPSEKLWAYEFWSGQFLGVIPARRRNPRGYVHPGDYQSLIASNARGALDIAFFGPAVKHICLRKVRPHPWVVGTSFHQSAGAELAHVHWDEKRLELSGELHRPAGEAGFLAFACAKKAFAAAEVGGRKVPATPSAHGSWHLPIVTESDVTRWSIRFARRKRRRAREAHH